MNEVSTVRPRPRRGPAPITATSPRMLAPTLLFLLLGLATNVPPSTAEWPFQWDNDERSDRVVAAELGDDGDLWVLMESHVQGATGARAVVLRIDPSGSLTWAATDPDQSLPSGLALRPNGGALVAGRVAGNGLRVTAFDPDGELAWTRDRVDVAWAGALFGAPAQPIWSTRDEAWWLPMQLAGDFVRVAWDGEGNELPDRTWALPEGAGGATSVRPRPGGGLELAGTGEPALDPPGWWTVALDAEGEQLWSHFDDGDTGAGIFGNAYFVETDGDDVVVWADDETLCGLFSLRVWSLDPADGSENWSTTWPPPGSCPSFVPNQVVASGGRLLAVGSSTVPSSGHTSIVSLDLDDGSVAWTRHFQGDTSPLDSALATHGGSALVGVSLFGSNPGPNPTWALAWNRAGEECAPPTELLPNRVQVARRGTDGRWLLVGVVFSAETNDDLLVQQIEDPCSGLFADGFEAGNTTAWSS